jgi:hypothetical protein
VASRAAGIAQGGGVVIPLEHDSLALGLSARLDERQQAWFERAQTQVAADPAAIATIFPAVGRGVGRGPLADPSVAGGVAPHAFTVDDAARVLLLVALSADAADELNALYRHGDAAERRGVLRALPYIRLGPTVGLRLVADALRTNDVNLIAAAMGPFAAEHLDDDAYAQGVLKCVFVGVPLTGVSGTLERTTPELAAMLARYVHERVAAGRTVPADVWPLIDRYPPQDELDEVTAELSNPHEDRRRAAEAALAARTAQDDPRN